MNAKLKKNSIKPRIKRRLASLDGCKHDLGDELTKLFVAFEEAMKLYSIEIVQTPPVARCRGFEASLFNSKLIQTIQKYFPEDWKFGKYKRFVLNKNGYLILCKKLNNNGMPMNVRTKLVDSINCQLMESLFKDIDYVEDPILYFGYKKDRVGNIFQPQLVYIDENQIKWTISEKDMFPTELVALEKAAAAEGTKASPKLRETKKKAVDK